MNSDESECSVCKVDCKSNICIGVEATSWQSECTVCIKTDLISPGSAGACLHNIDCECDNCIESDTFLGSERLNCDEIEIIWPCDFHILDDPQSVDLQKRLHISTPEAEHLFDRTTELQTKIEIVLRKITSLSLLRDIWETMAAKVNQPKSLIEAFEREVFKANRHITLEILARNNLIILFFICGCGQQT
ncbi:uncharacterized protein LOC107003419 [Solanum pennellii]|uniref:Uncharacterized protein LOC107003419 n=1 Tax=Solanum pennellii TaxID=28526 RepID=A0ABM1FIA0_SOLPN|nr:uncharacterized protein LOC107003419 [Solanum pennellii]